MNIDLKIEVCFDDNCKFKDEDLQEINKLLECKKLYPYFLSSNIFKVNERYLRIDKKVFDINSNTILLYIDSYIEL